VLVRSRAGPSILLFVLILLVFVPPFLEPRNVWMWVLAGVSLAGVVLLYLRENRKYGATREGLICRAFLLREEIAWREVEAIGTQLLRSKHGPIGTTFHVYGARCVLRPLFTPEKTGEFSRMLRERCPQAVWMDEDMGMFVVPESGEEQAIREVVERHARRLKWYHGVRAVLAMGVLVPLGMFVYLDSFALPRDLAFGGLVLLLFVAVSWTHWAALWRLRR